MAASQRPVPPPWMETACQGFEACTGSGVPRFAAGRAGAAVVAFPRKLSQNFLITGCASLAVSSLRAGACGGSGKPTIAGIERGYHARVRN